MNSARDFNLITRKLPSSITLSSGEEIQLFPNTARAIDCLQILDASDVPENAKITYVLTRMVILTEEQKKSSASEVFEKVCAFLAGPPMPRYQKSGAPQSGEKLCYWALDSAAITASFRKAYGISLSELQNLHFWEFMALFENLDPDTSMGSLMQTRASVIDPKATPEQKLHQNRRKKGARPEDDRPLEEKEKDAMTAFGKAFG